MALDYISVEELAKALRKGAVDELDEADAAELASLCTAVSRLADNYLEVEDGYYIPEDAPRTERVYGSGASTIALPSPVYGSVTVSAPEGVSVPNFDLDGHILLTLTEGGDRTEFIVWPEGIPFTVSGMWGVPEIPPQLKEACLQVAVRLYKERPDGGFQGIVTATGQYETLISRGFPSVARLILDNMKRTAVNEVAPSTLVFA